MRRVERGRERKRLLFVLNQDHKPFSVVMRKDVVQRHWN